VPVPSHCRQSSTLIPMQSSAGQSAVALRGTHMLASRSEASWPVAGAFVANRFDWLWCDDGGFHACGATRLKGVVDLVDTEFTRELRQPEQGKGTCG